MMYYYYYYIKFPECDNAIRIMLELPAEIVKGHMTCCDITNVLPKVLF